VRFQLWRRVHRRFDNDGHSFERGYAFVQNTRDHRAILRFDLSRLGEVPEEADADE
jgi:hypothetical protein